MKTTMGSQFWWGDVGTNRSREQIEQENILLLRTRNNPLRKLRVWKSFFSGH